MVCSYNVPSLPHVEDCHPQAASIPLYPSLLPHPSPPTSATTVFNQMACITPHLFLSAATALDNNTLGGKVTLVINTTRDLPLYPLAGARSIRVSVEDDCKDDISKHLTSVTTAMRDEVEVGGVVLVHCVAGVSRSATICLAYLTRYHCSLGEAWHHVKTIRPWVRPNHAFMQQLGEWEKLVRPGMEVTNIERLKGSEGRLARKG